MTCAEFLDGVTIGVLVVLLLLALVGLYFSVRCFGGPVDPLEYPEDEDEDVNYDIPGW